MDRAQDSQRELAERNGVHPSTMRGHLKALAKHGLAVKPEERWYRGYAQPAEVQKAWELWVRPTY